MKKKVLAIFVLYNPNYLLITESITAVAENVDYVWISDNSDKENKLTLPSNVSYFFMGGNKGIAEAQNKGISYALENKYDRVIFFDQDSTITPDFIRKIIIDFDFLKKYDTNAMGMGPLAVNRDSGMYLGKKRSILEERWFGGKKFLLMSEFLSSATIMDTIVFQKLGPLKSELFIDGVDYEILWRAQFYLGARFYRTTNCVMTHQLGEGDKTILGRKCHIPSAFRVYFEIRNVLILSSLVYTPVKWKRIELCKAIVKIVLYPIVLTPKKIFLRNALLGFKDGLKYLCTKKIYNSLI